MRILTLPEILAEELRDLQQTKPTVFSCHAYNFLKLAVVVLLGKRLSPAEHSQEVLHHLPNHATWSTYYDEP